MVSSFYLKKLICLDTHTNKIFYYIEIHPKCSNCQRLGMKCSYVKQFNWGEETLNGGTTFGRSNQYKKKSIDEKYNNYLNHNKGVAINLEAFKNQINVSLTNMVKDEKIPWSNIENEKIYFINTSFEDFIEKPVQSSQSSITLSKNNRKSNNTAMTASNKKLMTILSSFFTNQSPNVVYTDTFIDTFNNDSHLSNSFTQSNSLLNSPSFQDLMNLDFDIPKYSLNDPNFINWNNFHDHAELCHFQFSCLSNEEKLLLNYFINSICPTCICYPKFSPTNQQSIHDNYGLNNSNPLDNLKKQTNPYLYLIVPLAFQSKMVMDTVMATSAHQLFLLGNSKYEEISNNYSTKSIDQLPFIIQEKQNSKSFDWDEILAAILMLCFKEISSNCDYKSSWIIYLTCAKSFLKKVDFQTNYSPLCKFFARYFIIHEIMGQTAWNEQKRISYENHPNTDFRIGFDDSDDNDDFMEYMINYLIQSDRLTNDDNNYDYANDEMTVDVVFGCCPYLVSLIQKISSLGRCYEDLEFESVNTKIELSKYILFRRDELEYETTHLDQKIFIYEIIDDDDKFRKNIEIIAEIKRLSTLLYLFARIDLETLYYNNGIRNKNFMEKYSEMQSVKNKLIELYNILPECPMSLLWPLFVFGLVCASDNDVERWFVLDKLVYLQKARELGSVKTAKDVLLAVWKELDLGTTTFRWKDMIKNRAESLSLA